MSPICDPVSRAFQVEGPSRYCIAGRGHLVTLGNGVRIWRGNVRDAGQDDQIANPDIVVIGARMTRLGYLQDLCANLEFATDRSSAAEMLVRPDYESLEPVCDGAQRVQTAVRELPPSLPESSRS